MIVVLDTNVWISALQFGKSYGAPVRALERAIKHDIIAIADELETEILEILTRKFAWEPARATSSINSILGRCLRVELRHSVKTCRDPKDDMFLECAALSQADFLVAGDKDLLVLGSYARTRIITPAEYLAVPF